MKKILLLAVIVLLLSLTMIPIVAADGEPQGSCPSGWELHDLSDHHHSGSEHGDHRHVGTDADQNGDGFICGKHVTPNGDIHVHIDNALPLND
jgi:hypothetical protein